jgi:pimeloyl-ACP methyl ester carboxylesterase
VPSEAISKQTAQWPAERAAERLPLEICQRDGIEEPLLCGTLQVPLNRQDPDGTKIGIFVVVIPALEGSSETAWIEHQGGPGFSSLGAARLFAVGGELEGFRARRDVILFDQRGIGESGGISCDALRPNPILRQRFPPELVKSCREELASRKVDLRHYSTSETVDDLDAIRAWLGYQRFDVGGWSYGPRLMLTYMQRYPQRVRTATLVVPVPVDYRRPLDWARFGQGAWEGLAKDCLAEEACARAIPDPKDDFLRLAKRLEVDPIISQFVHPETGETMTARVDRGVLSELLWQTMLSTAGARKLPWLFHQAALGDSAPLIRDQTPTEPGELWFEPLYLSVICPEEVAHIRPDEIDSAVHGTVIGRHYIDSWIETCRIWDLPPAPGTPVVPKTLTIPTLVITGGLDPVALPEYGERIASNLPNSLHVTITERGHNGGDMSHPECLVDLILQFLEQGSVDGLDTTCLTTMKAPPFQTGSTAQSP